ncbi:hypothetical protein QBC46DRAFT_442308 [Diplogelasinospora grovesii]|uniref:Uncharacterized protein n=1 Tax=Diplogelasinospora grovesii TaxID=303347 RepID=A0AAN6N2L9_9PEZI|nr:hypothetical protein QBC46DRAFT_442308 [Diplogelasinospora grovesii]
MSAPPVTRDAWSYCGGDFYVEVSGHNRHRRATYPELQSIFADPDSSKSRPAHWYEAQLLHHGLPPSKVKGTASMRLWAAVNKGDLAVETDLRKEWAKSERETKQALKKQQTAEVASSSKTVAAKKGTKRKADDAHAGAGTNNVSINLSVSIGPQGIVQFGAAPKSEPASKKAKTTKTAAVEKAPKTTTTPKKTTAPKATAAKATAAKTAAATKAEKPPTASATPKTVSAEAPPRKQTARRGASSGGNRTVSSRPAPTAAPSPAPTTHRLQLARRGGFSVPSRGGRSAARADGPPGYVTAPYEEHYDEPPPPYEEIYDHGHDYSSDAEAIHYSDDDENFHDAPLGLLDGRYHVACRGPPEFESENDTMILTLDGDALWGSFEIGPLTGILRFDERPRASSYAFLGFHWRAEDPQGDCHHGSAKNGGLIRFEGYGKITGQLPVDDQFLTFDGRREDGQGTRSEISAWEMRRRWDELGRPPNFTYARF